MASSSPLTFDIGLTERALRALLDRRLARVGLTFPEWTALVTLDGGALTREALADRQVAGNVVPDRSAADAVVDGLLASGLVASADGGMSISPAGEAVYRPLRREVAETTQALFAGLPPGDIAATRRTLREVARRVGASLDSP